MTSDTCDRCDRETHRYRSKQNLCEVHYRVVQMRDSARSSGKYTPTPGEMNQMVEALIANGMKCEACSVEMVWGTGERGRSDVVSLQHDRSGDVRLICMGCNIRHYTFPDDTFYNHADRQSAHCARCHRTLPLSSFYVNARGRRAGSCCKECRKELNREMWKVHGRRWYANSMERKHENL